MEAISGGREMVEQVPAPVPIFTAYEKLVAKLIASIDEGVTQFPGYDDDLSDMPKGLRRLVNLRFLELTVNAIDASSELQGVDQLDAMECRDTVQYSQAIRALIVHFQSVARRLELLSRSRDAKAGRGALRIYHIAKRVASNPNNTHLVIHVENLRAELQRSRLRRRSKKAAAQPLPAAETAASTPEL